MRIRLWARSVSKMCLHVTSDLQQVPFLTVKILVGSLFGRCNQMLWWVFSLAKDFPRCLRSKSLSPTGALGA